MGVLRYVCALSLAGMDALNQPCKVRSTSSSAHLWSLRGARGALPEVGTAGHTCLQEPLKCFFVTHLFIYLFGHT